MKKKPQKPKIPPDWAGVPMSREAQTFYESTFLPSYENLLSNISKIPLAVLVWGPGEKGGDLYEKRLQIRGELRSHGLAAVFSEEISEGGIVGEFSARVSEMCQAIAADFVVVIQSSPGSVAEVHDLAGLVQEVGRKMLIFIDERHQEGYSFKGALRELRTLYNNVETYEYPKDIRECNLVSSVLKKTRMLQAAKWRASLR